MTCGVNESALSRSRQLPGSSFLVMLVMGMGWKLGLTPSVLTVESFWKVVRMSCSSLANVRSSSSLSFRRALSATRLTTSGVISMKVVDFCCLKKVWVNIV